ncbi:unnamed protein product [Closterium sp. NIES-53]
MRLPSRCPCCPVPSRRPCCLDAPADPSRRPCRRIAPAVPSRRVAPAVPFRPVAPAVPSRRPLLSRRVATAPSVPPRRAVRPVPSFPHRASRPVPSHAPHVPCPSVAPRAPCLSVVPPLRPARPSRPVRPVAPAPYAPVPGFGSNRIYLYAFAMATPRVLRFDAQATDPTHAYSACYARERADVTAWKSHDAAACIVLSSLLLESEETHFTQVCTASEFLTAIKARYATPTTVSLGRLFLPFPFPDLASFERTADLITHPRSLDSI